ncbi:NADAR family protein [Corynebacterium freiburgense]|uniref:NADAR family protein n=1 Tax=Corynebacterium freiburgense TaxID=556548 RepID=UPI0003FF1CBA|nr:NADAR family protein [Corynebacterium freiburgense]WJZ03083.1 Swarming motility protein YbiA [Corynebacterium freiburgense]
MKTIYFYTTNDPYGEFSNFARYGFYADDKYWPTAEHYFQAQKFTDPKLREKIRRTPSPLKAANIGRDRKNPLRPDWENIKEDVMYQAVIAKFRHNSELAEILIATGNAQLVEHTGKDRYWGDGGDGTGLNRLGKILMRVRAELSQEAE